MGKVHVVKITTANFEALEYKSGDTLYFVNETGTFSPESMETNGRVYLGDKLLSSFAALLLASGKKIMYNGDDVTANENLGDIVANARGHWYGSQGAYDDIVEDNHLQNGVAYHIEPQADYNETNHNSLAYIKNIPPMLNLEIEGTVAKFSYAIHQ